MCSKNQSTSNSEIFSYAWLLVLLIYSLATAEFQAHFYTTQPTDFIINKNNKSIIYTFNNKIYINICIIKIYLKISLKPWI